MPTRKSFLARALPAFLPAVVFGCTFSLMKVALSQETDDQLWLQLDSNRDGWLDGRELTRDWIAFDADNDHEVTKAEFLAGRIRVLSKPKVVAPVASMADSFQHRDLAGNCYSTSDESSGLNIPKLDSNRDGVISLEEYIGSVREPQLQIASTRMNADKPQVSQSWLLTTFQTGNTQQLGNSPSGTNDSSNTQPILGKMVAGKPLGFFYMQKYWIATRTLENSCWYFTADGRVFQDLTIGFSEKDLKAHKGSHGTFEVRSGKLTVAWAGEQPSTAEMELTDEGFYWDTGSYLPIQPFNGKSLAGDYSGGSSSTFSGTSSMVAKNLRLNADGSFTMSGVTSFRTEEDSTRGTKSQPLAGGSSDTSGRWKQDGFYLTLTFNSGETQRQIIFPFDDKETPVYPDRLYLSGIMYKKQ